MSIATQISEAESRLKAARITVDEFCKTIGVNRATWQRWKSGKYEPRIRVWRIVERALADVAVAVGARAA